MKYFPVWHLWKWTKECSSEFSIIKYILEFPNKKRGKFYHSKNAITIIVIGEHLLTITIALKKMKRIKTFTKSF